MTDRKRYSATLIIRETVLAVPENTSPNERRKPSYQQTPDQPRIAKPGKDTHELATLNLTANTPAALLSQLRAHLTVLATADHLAEPTSEADSTYAPEEL